MKYISNQTFNGEQVYIETEGLRADFELSSRVVIVNGKDHSINFKFNELSKDDNESNLVLEAECEDLQLATSIPVTDLEELVKQCINLVNNDELPEQNDYIKGLIDTVVDNLFSTFRRDNLVENIEYKNIVGLVKNEDKNLFGTIDGFLYNKNSLEIKGNSDFVKDMSEENNVIIEVSLGNVAFRIKGSVANNTTVNIADVEKISLQEIPDSFLNMKTVDDFFGDTEEYLIYRRGLILDQQDSEALSMDIDDLDF